MTARPSQDFSLPPPSQNVQALPPSTNLTGFIDVAVVQSSKGQPLPDYNILAQAESLPSTGEAEKGIVRAINIVWLTIAAALGTFHYPRENLCSHEKAALRRAFHEVLRLARARAPVIGMCFIRCLGGTRAIPREFVSDLLSTNYRTVSRAISAVLDYDHVSRANCVFADREWHPRPYLHFEQQAAEQQEQPEEEPLADADMNGDGEMTEAPQADPKYHNEYYG